MNITFPKLFLRTLYCFLTAMLLYLLLWAANKGFDLTDESFYLMSYNNPDKILVISSLFHKILPALFSFKEPNPLNYRLLKILLIFFTSIVLSICFINYCKWNFKKKIDFSKSFLFISLGISSTYAWLPQTPSYNDLANSLMVSVFAVLLSGQTNHSILFLGPTLFLLFLTKFSAGLVFLAASMAWIFFHKTSVNDFLKKIITLTLTMISSFIFMGWAWGSFDFLTSLLTSIVTTSSTKIHSPLSLINIYIKDLLSFINTLLVYLPFYIIFYLMGRREWSLKTILKNPLTYIFIYGFIHYYLKFRFHLPPMVSFRTFELYYVLNIFLFSYLAGLKHLILSKYFYYFTIISLIIPFIGAAGSANSLLIQGYIHIFSIFMLFVFLISMLPKDRRSNSISFILSSIFLFSVNSQIFLGIVYYPYRQNSSLIDYKIKCESFYNLYLNQEKCDFFNELRDIKSSLKINDNEPIVSFYNGPGAVYALKGYTPGFPWYIDIVPGLSCRAMDLAASEMKYVRLILLDSSIKDEELKCMNKTTGKTFPDDFYLYKTIKKPFNDEKEIKVYFLKSQIL